MTIKPFEIQGAQFKIGGVQLEAGTTGVVIPGITQATSYTVEEVEDTEDQTHQFTPNSEITVYDYVQKNYSGGNDIPPTFATYLATTDDEGYIDDIEVIDGGSYTSQEATSNAANDMWAWEAPPTYLYTYTQSDMTDPYGLYVSNGGTGIYNIQGDRTKWVDGTKFDNLLAQTPPMVFTVFLVGDSQQYLFTLYPNAQGGFLQGTWLPTPPVPSTTAIESIAFGSPDPYSQIPFRPKMRAGEVETIGGGGGSLGDFNAEGTELYANNNETIQINAFTDNGKQASIMLNPELRIAKMAVNTDRSWGFNEGSDYTVGAAWSDSEGGGAISLSGVSQYLYDTMNVIGRYTETKIVLNGNTYSFNGWNGGGTVGVDAYFNLYTTQGPGGDPVAVTDFQINGIFENRVILDDDEGDYGFWLDNNNFRVDTQSDINLYAKDDIRIQGEDLFSIRNVSIDEPISISTRYSLNNQKDWQFTATGILAGPSEGLLTVNGIDTKDASMYVGITTSGYAWPNISNILTSSVTRASFASSISALPDVGAIEFSGITTWTEMNGVRYYYQKYDDISISLYVDVNRNTPLDTTGFGGNYLESTVNTYVWQQNSANDGASNGWVDSTMYTNIASVPLTATVTSADLVVNGETIVSIDPGPMNPLIYIVTFSNDTGTGRHQTGVDYTASWTSAGSPTGSATYVRDGYDVRIAPTVGVGTGAIDGRVKIQSGLVELPEGTTIGSTLITAPVDDVFGIRTQFYPTVSGLSEVGTGIGVIVFDTTNNDDITVVQPGWQINTGSENSPIWEVVTLVDSSVPNQFTINIATDVEFSAGFVFEFRNPSAETDTWYFNSDRSFTTPSGGKIRHVNNDLIIEAPGLTDVIVLRTASGELVINSDGSLTFPDSTTQTTAYTGNELALSTVSKTYIDTPIALDLTKSVNKLVTGSYILADGVEGQVIHLVPQAGVTTYNTITVTVANARGHAMSGTDWILYPFQSAGPIDNSGICTLIYTDGQWQQTGGLWD